MIALISAAAFGVLTVMWCRKGWLNLGIKITLALLCILNLASGWPLLVFAMEGGAA